ncbi:spore germination protein GerPB [Bacillus tianshenii]|nr:spore germination protein GerPB [Bacillus tianshenii]
MNIYVNQQINIHSIKIEGITNSSVFQIGSAGIIKSLSNLYNTGGYIEEAPEVVEPLQAPYVPLPPPQ